MFKSKCTVCVFGWLLWQLTKVRVLQDRCPPPRCWRFRGRLAGGTRRSQGENRWSTMVAMIQLYQLGWVFGLKAGPCQSRDRSWQSPLPSGVGKQLKSLNSYHSLRSNGWRWVLPNWIRFVKGGWTNPLFRWVYQLFKKIGYLIEILLKVSEPWFSTPKIRGESTSKFSYNCNVPLNRMCDDWLSAAKVQQVFSCES